MLYKRFEILAIMMAMVNAIMMAMVNAIIPPL
jgi:hypothetical protein